jgi:hypothetical protein
LIYNGDIQLEWVNSYARCIERDFVLAIALWGFPKIGERSNRDGAALVAIRQSWESTEQGEEQESYAAHSDLQALP